MADCFAKDPKETFGLDFNSQGHVCAICRDTKLKLHNLSQINLRNPPDEQPVLLPCGHFFGAACLLKYFDHACLDRECTWQECLKPQCPICRFPLQRRCGHLINYRHVPHPIKDISAAALFEECGIRKTLPEGGNIPSKCFTCELRKLLLEDKEQEREQEQGERAISRLARTMDGWV